MISSKARISFAKHIASIRFAFQFSTIAASTKGNKKSYYQLLEVPSSATMANIKNNYLRLAKIYHPDIYRGKDKDRFQKIQQAYKVLSDRVKRTQYDQQIGIRANPNQASQEAQASATDDGKTETGKPKNTMSYESAAQEEKIDFDAEFNKFFNQKPKTQFEEIRLAEEPEIRSMSQAERIRRHFSSVYESAETLSKAQYQKQFSSILNDQINQKNRMYDDKKKQEQRQKQMNSQKGKKRLSYQVVLAFGIVFMVTMPVLYSWVTKYRLEKELKVKWEEHDRKLEKMAQEIDLNLRFKYQ